MYFYYRICSWTFESLISRLLPEYFIPYAREVIAGLVSKGSFPELHLSPINFDALYVRRLQEQMERTTEAQPA